MSATHSRRKASILELAALVGCIVALAGDAAGETSTDVPPEDFQKADAALAQGDNSNAIVVLEGIADSGVVHPDVSFDRGLAYARRARSPNAEPGDLGRAAAAFEEAQRLRPSDTDADKALDLVRAEVARRRSKQDKNDVVVRPSIDRVILEALSPAAWSLATIVASSIFAAGVLMRWRKSGWIHLAGAVIAPLALVSTLALAPIAFFARDHAATRHPGVMVVPETKLETDEGKFADAPAIPEASLVEIGPHVDNRVLVRWGNYEGWAPRGSVRQLVLD